MKLIISVPKPCHEDWNSMSQREQGRHCEQCDHVVADLTRATDAELVRLFTSDAKPKCARFSPAQLDRLLAPPEPPRQTGVLPIAAFTTLAAVASGCESIGQQSGRTLGEPALTQPAPVPQATTGIAIVDPLIETSRCTTLRDTAAPQPDEILELVELGNVSVAMEGLMADDIPSTVAQATTEVCGTLVDQRTNEPLPFATIAIRFLGAHTRTDEGGNFKLTVPARITRDMMILDVRHDGYDDFSKEVFSPGSGPEPFPDVPVSGPFEGQDSVINGFVTEVPHGQLLPGTLVRIVGSDVRVRCDEHGYFGLRVPAELVGQEITLEFDHPRAGTMSLPVLTDRLPLELPVKFAGTLPEPGPRWAEGCLEVGVLRIQKHYETELSVVGGIGVMYYKPTRWQRLTAPFRRRW